MSLVGMTPFGCTSNSCMVRYLSYFWSTTGSTRVDTHCYRVLRGLEIIHFLPVAHTMI